MSNNKVITPPPDWSSDLLDRKSDAEFLQKFLTGRFNERKDANKPSSYVLNLNSGWGQGKSYFLERFGADLSAAKHVVAKVNAWRDDYADDPLLSVMAAIDSAVQPDDAITAKTKGLGKKVASVAGQVAAAAAKGAIKQAASRYLGDEVKELLSAAGLDESNSTAILTESSKMFDKVWDAEAKSLLSKYVSAQRTVEQFKDNLREFIASLGNQRPGPLFILIDELDRCRPTYAVALLERVKHLFDVDGINFVIATDTEQLQHSIGAIYGAGFDSKRYLNRFFDSSYTFENPSYGTFISSLIKGRPIRPEKILLPANMSLEEFVAGGVDFYGLSLRDAQQMYELVANVATVWDQKFPLVSVMLIPLVIGQVLGVPIDTTESFWKELQTVSERSGRSTRWRVPFPPSNYERVGPELVDVDYLYRQFCRLMKLPLPKLFESSPKESADRWCIQTLQNEFSVLHGGIHRGSGPFSIIKAYPQLIRTAGRLQTN